MNKFPWPSGSWSRPCAGWQNSSQVTIALQTEQLFCGRLLVPLVSRAWDSSLLTGFAVIVRCFPAGTLRAPQGNSVLTAALARNLDQGAQLFYLHPTEEASRLQRVSEGSDGLFINGLQVGRSLTSGSSQASPLLPCCVCEAATAGRTGKLAVVVAGRVCRKRGLGATLCRKRGLSPTRVYQSGSPWRVTLYGQPSWMRR